MGGEGANLWSGRYLEDVSRLFGIREIKHGGGDAKVVKEGSEVEPAVNQNQDILCMKTALNEEDQC
jgi:hypothetical protein